MNVEQLPFDQYQRYRLVADLLGTLRGKQKLEDAITAYERGARLSNFERRRWHFWS